MADINDIVGWVLDYACCHREFEVVKAIALRHSGSTDFHVRLKVPTVRYISAIVNHIVDSSQLDLFSLACKLIDEIYNLAKECIPFKIYARLSFGMKMQCLFHHLKEGSTLQALAKLNELIPRGAGMTNTHGITRYEKSFHKVTANFRKFFLPLLANERQREAYLQNDYPQEYGEKYMTCLRKLMYQFLKLVEEQLPSTVIDKILDIGTDKIPAPPCVAFNIVLEYCHGKRSLSSSDLIDILTSISPIDTQDNVVTNHNFLATSSTESDGDLFDSSDSSQSMLSTQPPVDFPKEEHLNSTKNDYTKLRNSEDSNSDLPVHCDVDNLSSPDLSPVKERKVRQLRDRTTVVSKSNCRKADKEIKSGRVKRRQCSNLKNGQSKRCKLSLKTTVRNGFKSNGIRIESSSSKRKKEGTTADAITDTHHIESSIPSVDFSCHTENSTLTPKQNTQGSCVNDSDKMSCQNEEYEAILEGLVVRDVCSTENSDYNNTRSGAEDKNSVSDINNISITSSDASRIDANCLSETESERIPSSYNTELNMSSNDYLTEVLHSIVLHKKQPFLQLCVIKLRRAKGLDVMRNGLLHSLYS